MCAAASNGPRSPLKRFAWVCCFVVASYLVPDTSAADTTTLTPDEAQAWRIVNEAYDWQQAESNAHVKIIGKGAEDVDGNLYFVGSKTYVTDADSIDDQNMFIARLNADDSLGWTKEVCDVYFVWWRRIDRCSS